MDGPRDYHTKWSQTENDKYHINSYVESNLKNFLIILLNDTNELLQNRKSYRYQKQGY